MRGLALALVLVAVVAVVRGMEDEPVKYADKKAIGGKITGYFYKAPKNRGVFTAWNNRLALVQVLDPPEEEKATTPYCLQLRTCVVKKGSDINLHKDCKRVGFIDPTKVTETFEPTDTDRFSSSFWHTKCAKCLRVPVVRLGGKPVGENYDSDQNKGFMFFGTPNPELTPPRDDRQSFADAVTALKQPSTYNVAACVSFYTWSS
eukprot:gnl/Hemi2/1550_TR554_c0_g2_i1.p1 gnl/Hemi2/1550_TR554_c0_g2~~gnl/Hemi2/1550_TR554_c0_g2_i1.p1  ORF type:complete len:222 (+),score=41.29 gnl/Hemi2/1550_TR554_c0_g2_i1:57-668(+)